MQLYVKLAPAVEKGNEMLREADGPPPNSSRVKTCELYERFMVTGALGVPCI